MAFFRTGIQQSQTIALDKKSLSGTGKRTGTYTVDGKIICASYGGWYMNSGSSAGAVSGSILADGTKEGSYEMTLDDESTLTVKKTGNYNGNITIYIVYIPN